MNASMIQQCKKYDLDISAEYKNISMNDINNAHQNGIRISVWLCRNEDMVDISGKWVRIISRMRGGIQMK